MSPIQRRLIVCMLGGSLSALPASALPADGARGDLPITDPTMLVGLGFEPDAANVYATPRAFAELLMTPGERAVEQEARLAEYRAAHEGSPAGGPFGTGTTGYSVIEARAIRPRKSETAHNLIADGRVCQGGPALFEAPFEALPHGAKLERVDVWYLDSSQEALSVSVVRVCRPDFEAGTPIVTQLGIVSSIGTGGYGFATIGPLDEDIDMQSCAYLAQVLLDGGPGVCSEFNTLRIGKLRAQWRRQISPPPASPTFADVGTDHPFFRHVEALAASGITGGCGDGSDFCPDASLTRGQMAVFLAEALGLHWGEITP